MAVPPPNPTLDAQLAAVAKETPKPSTFETVLSTIGGFLSSAVTAAGPALTELLKKEATKTIVVPSSSPAAATAPAPVPGAAAPPPADGSGVGGGASLGGISLGVLVVGAVGIGLIWLVARL